MEEKEVVEVNDVEEKENPQEISKAKAKKKRKKIVRVLVMILIIVVIIPMALFCGFLYLIGGGLIDPMVSFSTLEEMQEALDEDFYYFEMNEAKMIPVLYDGIASTQDYRKRKRGDFYYTGYIIYYYEENSDSHISDFDIVANTNKDMDSILSEVKNWDSLKKIEIADITCVLMNTSSTMRLYFNLSGIRYCFTLKDRGFEDRDKEISEFLALCEELIKSRYKYE